MLTPDALNHRSCDPVENNQTIFPVLYPLLGDEKDRRIQFRHGRDLWQRYWDNALNLDGKDVESLAQAAADAGAIVSIGVVERDGDFGGGTLYCTQLYFSAGGQLMGKHRKLKPTGTERLIWGKGDGSTLPVFATAHGRIGGLTCWENYMPLARMYMFSQGVEIYLAPTADSRDGWQASMRHIALEGRCFVLSCNQFVTKDMYPQELCDELADQPAVMCRGGSVAVSPLGEVLGGPLWDEEGIVHAQLDLAQVARAKLDFDVVGHYARPDVFQLHVDTAPRAPVTTTDPNRRG